MQYRKEDENYIYYLVEQNLKKIRKNKDISVVKLAQMTNYSEGFINNIESKNYYQTFSIGTIWRFAHVLNVDIKNFFEEL